jgi:hypothetical protein
VYAQALASAILSGGTEAELEVVTDEGRERRETATKVAGSGLPGSRVPRVGAVAYSNEATTTIVRTDDLELTVLRLIAVSTEAARTPGIFVPYRDVARTGHTGAPGLGSDHLSRLTSDRVLGGRSLSASVIVGGVKRSAPSAKHESQNLISVYG